VAASTKYSGKKNVLAAAKKKHARLQRTFSPFFVSLSGKSFTLGFRSGSPPLDRFGRTLAVGMNERFGSETGLVLRKTDPFVNLFFKFVFVDEAVELRLKSLNRKLRPA
jgi:hypothetical protein